jgi:hypothetical protein
MVEIAIQIENAYDNHGGNQVSVHGTTTLAEGRCHVDDRMTAFSEHHSRTSVLSFRPRTRESS